MNKNLSLIIADDHPVFLRGLEGILEKYKWLTIVARPSDGMTAMEAIRTLKPDIAIVDLYMPGMDGVKVVTAVKKENLPTKIIILTMHNEEHLIRSLFALGLPGYILKENAISEIMQCIEVVAAGRVFYSPQAASYLLNKSESSGTDRAKLTPTEIKILELIGQEKSSQQIAQELFLSDNTIRNHRANICKKLGISGNFALVRYALKMKENKGGRS